MLDTVLPCAAIGSHDTVRASLQAFIERTGADELMLTSQIFDHSQRLYSYQIAGEIAAELAHEGDAVAL